MGTSNALRELIVADAYNAAIKANAAADAAESDPNPRHRKRAAAEAAEARICSDRAYAIGATAAGCVAADAADRANKVI